MKRREFSSGLLATGLTAPMLIHARPVRAEGQTTLYGRLNLDVGGNRIEPGNVVGQNAEIVGWKTNRELELTRNGNAYRVQAHEGTLVGPAYLADGMVYFLNTNHFTLPPRLRIVKDEVSLKVPRKLSKLDPGLRLTLSYIKSGPEIGAVYADSKYTYLDVKPGF